MRIIIFTLLLSLTNSVFGLAIDERLSIRILKISDTRKTALTNRGLEDGLVVGDHAKFFLTKGVVARGVVIKASPTRSVWSMYRVINANDLAADRMMNIKIAKPIKVTDDASKMISKEDVRTKISGIALAAGARDLPAESSEVDKNELAALGAATDGDEFTTVLTDRDWELWGSFNLNSLSSNVSYSNLAGDTNLSGSLSKLDFSLGLEIYFDNTSNFFSKFSITPFIHKAVQETTSLEGVVLSSDILEFGAGVNWHLFQSPYALNRFIWYLNGSFGIGSSTDDTSSLDLAVSPGIEEFAEGSISFYSFGLGMKYYVFNGFGIRAMVDYYSRTESYARELVDTLESFETIKVSSGPRFQVGISYRW